MDEWTAISPVPAADLEEADSVARELVRSYLRGVKFYQTEMQHAPADADAAAREYRGAGPEGIDEPGNLITWGTLRRLIEHDPERGWREWERVKQEARAELATGHRAAQALEWDGRPWDRAQFLAIRDAFRSEWQPQGGVEDALIDSLAQAHSMYLKWLGILHLRTSLDAQHNEHVVQERGRWQPQRIEDAAAVEQAAAMADRFHRLFLRTLRALRDLRRYGPVIVQGAAQVNVGNHVQAQQVTLATRLEYVPSVE